VIVIFDVNYNVGDVVSANRANAVMFNKFPNRSTSNQRWIARSLPFAVFSEDTQKAFDIVHID
jgi:hypothetical protein